MDNATEEEDGYADGRPPWEWKSRYPKEANRKVKCEALILTGLMIVGLSLSAVCLGLNNATFEVDFGVNSSTISIRWVAIYLVGFVGSVTYSLKWLIHAVAKGKWHEDRLYWRVLTPMSGGVYACVIIALWSKGLIGGPEPVMRSSDLFTIAPFAFLIGYFSDGVSGLLTNVANATFGTIKRKK